MSWIQANIRGEPYELIYIMIARAAGISTPNPTSVLPQGPGRRVLLQESVHDGAAAFPP